MAHRRTEPDKFEHASSAIRRSMPSIVAHVVSRFKRELPEAGAQLSSVAEATLADHTVTLIAEVATLLHSRRNIEKDDAGSPAETARQREMLLSDGRTIYSVLGELHGRQRRKLKWTDRALKLEYKILISEIEKTARKGSATGEDDTEVSAEINRILCASLDAALKTFRTPAKTAR
jgi:hypothetical protein